MKKKCIIIHGGPGDIKSSIPHNLPQTDWFPWIKNQLVLRGIDTIVPAMPDTWNPVYDDYRKEFEKYKVDEETMLIGHSRGCAFLVRWLGDSKQRIKKLILVAPYRIAVGNSEYKKRFYDFKIDPTIKERIKEIVMFTSDNEEPADKKSLEIYHQALDGKIVNLSNHGHYTLKDMDTEEFPELLEEVLKEEL